MSYDLEQLHAISGLTVASVRFATSTDLAGTAVIAAVTGASPIVHGIFLQGSTYSSVQLERATGAASAYWIGFAGQTGFQEMTRIKCDRSASVMLSGATGIGIGVVRVYFTYSRDTGNTSV